ncbi:PstS family phosphate ABC transporter substrate-binding protein [Massilia cavernae]|uniref:Phosphate ABC transporter substrate-binding protein n=1 Tax=Massilia cavernae TaxID=2320864 RepID=A0A418XFP5_9BURK|nr:substrate-binding domain-containing protein [Massilia cavernae]RJG11279.1 hypothetical protein D3872_20670 [Massilia cavernae]
MKTPSSRTRASLAAALLLAAGGSAAAHAPGTLPAPDAPYVTAQGAVRVVGYNDMQEMLEALNRLFAKSHPGIRFELQLKGTRTAPPALASGGSLFAPMGAEFSDAELAAYRQVAGHAPLAIRVAHASLDPRALSSPLALYVNHSNPLRELTLAQAMAAFTAGIDGRTALVWGDLGLGGAWATRQVRLCGLAPDTALGIFMRRHHFDGRQYASHFQGFRQSADAVSCVAGSPAALGFAGSNRVAPGARILAVAPASGGHAVLPSASAVAAGGYPLDRHLLIYVRKVPGKPLEPLAEAYLRMALSPAGQQAIGSGTLGYQPLNPQELADELGKLGE